jgi:RNA polymerase sigma factor (sigma-70 family)
MPQAPSWKALKRRILIRARAWDRLNAPKAVREAIAELAPGLREALILFTYEDMSYEQIATIQRCSTKAVETRLYRARASLRKRLARWLVVH